MMPRTRLQRLGKASQLHARSWMKQYGPDAPWKNHVEHIKRLVPYLAAGHVVHAIAKAMPDDGYGIKHGVDAVGTAVTFGADHIHHIAQIYNKLKAYDKRNEKITIIEQDDYVYHGTPHKNMQSIIKNGLRPNEYGNPLNFAHEQNLADYYGKNGKVLRLHKSNIPVNTRHDDLTKRSWTMDTVHPDKLEVNINGEWKPLHKYKLDEYFIHESLIRAIAIHLRRQAKKKLTDHAQDALIQGDKTWDHPMNVTTPAGAAGFVAGATFGVAKDHVTKIKRLRDQLVAREKRR